MHRNIFAACGALAIAGLTLSASQTPTPTQPGTTPAQPSPSGTTVTVTGCLKPWTGAASNSTTTAGAAGAMAQYVLTDVEDKRMSGGSTASGTTPATPGSPSTPRTPRTPGTPSAPGTPGTPDAPGSTGAANRGKGAFDKDDYLLRADSTAVNFSQHVNHKVEVTGRKMAKDAHASGTGTTGREHAPGKRDMATLTVTSLKMVSATCP